MEDEPDEQPSFRWNPQAVFMLFFFMLAMAIPLMGVVWFARGYLSASAKGAKPAPAASANVEPLRAALENVAKTEFGASTKLDAEDEISVRCDDVGPRAARIADLAKQAGGSSLETAGADAGVRRLKIRVPSTRDEMFRQTIAGGTADFSTVPAGPEMKLLDVVVEKP
jgi:hypothetical protein